MKYLIYGRTLEDTNMIINGFDVEIIRKKVKNINLKVYPNLEKYQNWYYISQGKMLILYN